MEPTALQRIGGLSPFGPIFSKELRITARRKRTYLLRTLYLAALLLVLLFTWLSTRGYGYGGGVAAQTQLMSELGLNFYRAFLIFSTIAMAIIGPVLTSTAISSERLSKTLNVLLMTPINTWQIVSGKLISRVWIALTLLGLSIPVLALVRLLGGVELEQMIAAVCLAVVVALHTAAIGLFFSTLVNRPYIAILLSYMTILFLEAFVPFVGIVGLKMAQDPRSIQNWAAVNWFMCMGMSAEGRFFRTDLWVNCTIVHLVVAALLLLASGAMLRRFTRKSGAQPAAVDPSSYIPVAAIAPPPLPLAPAETGSSPPPLPTTNHPAANVVSYAPPSVRRSKSGNVREVSDNPILWRESRRPLTSKLWQRIVFGGGCLLLLLISYAILADGQDLTRSGCHVGFAIIFNGLAWLLISVLAATAIAQEKESDTWTLLMTTPLSGSRIVWGKVVGLLRRMLWPYLLVLAHFTLFTLNGTLRPAASLIALWVIFSFNAIWVATGVYLSLRLRKVTTAVILNLLLAVIAYPLPALLLNIAGETLDRNRGEALMEQVGWYLPYTYIGVGMSGLDEYRSANNRGRNFWLPRNPFAMDVDGSGSGYYGRDYNSGWARQPEYLAILFTIGICHLGAAALLIQWTAFRFDRIVRRAPQDVRRRRPKLDSPRLPSQPQLA